MHNFFDLFHAILDFKEFCENSHDVKLQVLPLGLARDKSWRKSASHQNKSAYLFMIREFKEKWIFQNFDNFRIIKKKKMFEFSIFFWIFRKTIFSTVSPGAHFFLPSLTITTTITTTITVNISHSGDDGRTLTLNPSRCHLAMIWRVRQGALSADYWTLGDCGRGLGKEAAGASTSSLRRNTSGRSISTGELGNCYSGSAVSSTLVAGAGYISQYGVTPSLLYQAWW